MFNRELPNFIKKMIDKEVAKQWAKRRKGLSQPINIFHDKKQKRIYLSEDDWNIVSEALTRLSGTREIDCTPIHDSIN